MDEFETELASHRGYLLRYARLHLRDAALAEDAVQDALTAALASRERFEGRSALRTWLTSILKHKIVDQLRSRERALTDGAAFLGEDAGRPEDDFDAQGRWIDPPADWGDPDAALQSGQFWRVFRMCCERMPARHALVFSMREVMDMTADEICKNLGISKSNLHVILFRARLSLRSCMTRNWLGPDHA